MLDRWPSALDPFAAVVRVFPCNALSPAIDSFAMRSDQEYPAVVQSAETRLEKVDERHLNFA
jgi:hypothetical protein